MKRRRINVDGCIVAETQHTYCFAHKHENIYNRFHHCQTLYSFDRTQCATYAKTLGCHKKKRTLLCALLQPSFAMRLAMCTQTEYVCSGGVKNEERKKRMKTKSSFTCSFSCLYISYSISCCCHTSLRTFTHVFRYTHNILCGFLQIRNLMLSHSIQLLMMLMETTLLMLSSKHTLYVHLCFVFHIFLLSSFSTCMHSMYATCASFSFFHHPI